MCKIYTAIELTTEKSGWNWHHRSCIQQGRKQATDLFPVLVAIEGKLSAKAFVRQSCTTKRQKQKNSTKKNWVLKTEFQKNGQFRILSVASCATGIAEFISQHTPIPLCILVPLLQHWPGIVFFSFLFLLPLPSNYFCEILDKRSSSFRKKPPPEAVYRMGRTEKRGTSLPALWYLEQTLKLRATKLSKEDERYLRNARLELFIPALRYLMVIYCIFDLLFLIEDVTQHRDLKYSIGRFFITLPFLAITFFCTFIVSVRKSVYFLILAHLTILVQSASTAWYIYNAADKHETAPVSPFLPMDLFVLFLLLRVKIVPTVICGIVAIVMNEVAVIVKIKPSTYLNNLFRTNNCYSHTCIYLIMWRVEIGSVVLYILCMVLGFIVSYIFEINFRSKYFLGKEIAKDRGAVIMEREKSEKLLYNILPRAIADSLKNDFMSEDKDQNDIHPPTIHLKLILDHSQISLLTTLRIPPLLFVIFVISQCMLLILACLCLLWCSISGEMNPEKLVSFLNDIFSAFDNLVHEFGLEKIKTIGMSQYAILNTILISQQVMHTCLWEVYQKQLSSKQSMGHILLQRL